MVGQRVAYHYDERERRGERLLALDTGRDLLCQAPPARLFWCDCRHRWRFDPGISPSAPRGLDRARGLSHFGP